MGMGTILKATISLIFLSMPAYGDTHDDVTRLSEVLKARMNKFRSLNGKVKTLMQEDQVLQARLMSAQASNACLRSFAVLAKTAVRLSEGDQESSSLWSSVRSAMTQYAQAQQEYFQSFESRISLAKATSSSHVKLSISTREIESLFSSGSQEELAILNAEQRLLNELHSAASFLRGIERGLHHANLHRCASTSENSRVLRIKVASWAAVFEKHLRSVGEQRLKRMKFRESVSLGFVVGLAQKENQERILEIDALFSKLDEANRSEEFLARLGKWWNEAHGSLGPGRGMIRTYQQFTGALLVLNADLIVAERFLAEAESLPVSNEIKNILSQTVIGYREVLLRTLRELTEKGWQKVFSLQKAYLEHYEKGVTIRKMACAEAILKHRGALDAVGTDRDFSMHEAGFIQVVDNCVLK